MTELLEAAFAKAAQLPPQEQDAIAILILNELTSDLQWDSAFTTSQDTLAQLAAEALSEKSQGRTQPLDPNRL